MAYMKTEMAYMNTVKQCLSDWNLTLSITAMYTPPLDRNHHQTFGFQQQVVGLNEE